MSALLYLPAILLTLFKRTGLFPTLLHLTLLLTTQALLGAPFLHTYPRSYLKYSYELGRVFLYKWTVNWRFVDEETFLSSAWARGLLLGHLGVLVLFAFRWCRRDQGGAWVVLRRGLGRPFEAPAKTGVTSDCTCLAW